MVHMNTTTLALAGLLLASMAALSGCTSTKTQLDIAYVPQRGSLSPLSTVKPLALAVHVDDQRDATVRDRLATMPAFGGGTPVKPNREVPLVLQDALRRELENNGHQVRPGKDADVNATVRFVLRTYWCCGLRSLETQYRVATIAGQVELVDARNARLLSKPVTSAYIKTVEYNIPEFEIMINGVLLEFVRNFARDPDIIAALRSIKPQSRASWRPEQGLP